jgi:hypothetical protein
MTVSQLTALYGIRMQVEALIQSVEADNPVVPVPDDGCPHPAEKQVNATVMGGTPMILCTACGEERPGVVQ